VNPSQINSFCSGKETAAHQQPSIQRAGVQELRPQGGDVGLGGAGAHSVEPTLQVVVDERLHHVDQPLRLQEHALVEGRVAASSSSSSSPRQRPLPLILLLQRYP
jgi:hypothetical protein